MRSSGSAELPLLSEEPPGFPNMFLLTFVPLSLLPAPDDLFEEAVVDV